MPVKNVLKGDMIGLERFLSRLHDQLSENRITSEFFEEDDDTPFPETNIVYAVNDVGTLLGVGTYRLFNPPEDKPFYPYASGFLLDHYERSIVDDNGDSCFPSEVFDSYAFIGYDQKSTLAFVSLLEPYQSGVEEELIEQLQHDPNLEGVFLSTQDICEERLLNIGFQPTGYFVQENDIHYQIMAWTRSTPGMN